MFKMFESLFALLTAGPGVGPLTRMLEAACTITLAPTAALLLKDGKTVRLLAIRGSNTTQQVGDVVRLNGLERAFGPPKIVANPEQLRSIERPVGLPPWVWAASVPVPIQSSNFAVSLVCADINKDVRRPIDILNRLTMLASITADEINLVALVAAQDRRLENISLRGIKDTKYLTPDNFFERNDSENLTFTQPVVIRFLAETLISNVRLRHRTDTSYYALRRWRKSIKRYQIDALRMLKAERSPALVDMIADEIATAAHRLFGSLSEVTIASVPCGNSGPDCLAQHIADQVGIRVGRPVARFFDDIDTRGASHPRRNIKRPNMQLCANPTGTILLIDDVATSGAHIAEATRLLAKNASSVLPLVWLADA